MFIVRKFIRFFFKLKKNYQLFDLLRSNTMVKI